MKINAKYLSVLFAGAALLSTGMIAQQEVSPDHFEDTPAVSKKAVAAKPTPKRERLAMWLRNRSRNLSRSKLYNRQWRQYKRHRTGNNLDPADGRLQD